MKMNDHHQRLWQNMIDLIQSYIDGQTEDFCSVVGKLEGALDASEIHDNALVNQWYNFWTPLEISRALEGNDVDKEKAIRELNAMKVFLLANKNDE